MTQCDIKHLEDVALRLDVGQRELDLAVDAPRAQQRLVERRPADVVEEDVDAAEDAARLAEDRGEAARPFDGPRSGDE